MHSINLRAVFDSEYPEIVRSTAELLLEHPYLDVGSFLKGLSKENLDELVGYCNAITTHTDDGLEFDSIVLLAEMLAQAEGTPLDSPDVQRTSNLMILLTFEDLYRKGTIEFHHEVCTLFGDITEVPELARLK